MGDNHFGSSLTFLLWLSGLVIYWRLGNRWIWWLFVSAQLLSLAAAGLGKYPYLANPRISMFLGPGICAFEGAGIQYWIDVSGSSATRRGWYRFAAVVCLLCAFGGLTRDVFQRVREARGLSHMERHTLAELTEIKP